MFEKDHIDAERARLANDWVDKMDEGVVADLSPLAVIVRSLHLLTDPRGNRITPPKLIF